MRAGRLSLAVGALVFAGKLVAWASTGSSAVLSDALESVVNVVAAGLLLWSLAIASRPADRDHPYGHGKVEFFSAGVEGTLIAVAAAMIITEAARDIWRGPRLRNLDLGLALVTAATLLNAGLGAFLIRVGRRTHSVALVADGRHLLTDVATSVAVLVGLALVRITGLVILDPLVAIAVAANILRSGYRITREAVGGLMDEADVELLRRLADVLQAGRKPWWIDVHSLRAWRSGATRHADLHLAVPRYYDAETLHRIDQEVHEALAGAGSAAIDAIVHFDPCRPRQCASCAMEACAVRSHPCTRTTPFTYEHATRADELLDSGAPVPPAPRP
jgi:cation diffusion facilitator family transporter